jgi:plastocyanin
MARLRVAALIVVLVALGGLASAQEGTLRGMVNVVHRSKHESGSADVVIWLTPSVSSGPVAPGPTARLVQKNKQFLPHVLAVVVGTQVEFPNQDLFFHDVFSIYRGKPFDLGLYESGAVRKVRFSQPGVSYIFCNIHPEMSAAVVALSTPYFVVTGRDGSFQVGHVPPGHYRLQVWHELTPETELTSTSRDLEITAGDNTLPGITLHSSDGAQEHLNKYGEAYTPDKPAKY